MQGWIILFWGKQELLTDYFCEKQEARGLGGRRKNRRVHIGRGGRKPQPEELTLACPLWRETAPEVTLEMSPIPAKLATTRALSVADLGCCPSFGHFHTHPEPRSPLSSEILPKHRSNRFLLTSATF